MPTKTTDPEPEPEPVEPDGGTPEPEQHEDLAMVAAEARRQANLSGDRGDLLAAEDAERELLKASSVPDWHEPAEAEDKASAICALVGDGLASDDEGGWTNLYRLIGLPRSEVAAVSSRPAGVTWLNSAGIWYIAVGEDRPADADGKRGVMLLTPPPEFDGPFPIYARTPTAIAAAPAKATAPPPDIAPPGL